MNNWQKTLNLVVLLAAITLTLGSTGTGIDMGNGSGSAEYTACLNLATTSAYNPFGDEEQNYNCRQAKIASCGGEFGVGSPHLAANFCATLGTLTNTPGLCPAC